MDIESSHNLDEDTLPSCSEFENVRIEQIHARILRVNANLAKSVKESYIDYDWPVSALIEVCFL